MMRKLIVTSLLIIALINGAQPALAQNPAASPTPQQQTPTTPQTPAPSQQPQQGDDEDVVRISTELVQVDAVVVDKDGRQVTDLRPEEFEIYEEGRRQEMTNLSYVRLEGAPSEQAATSDGKKSDARSGNIVPPARIRPEQVRRTIALVVDDLGMSFESTAFVHDALRKFVRDEMQTNDLVAIIRTSVGSGALQQFTTDKRQLNAAIDRVRWSPSGRGGVSAFAPISSQRTGGEDEQVAAMIERAEEREEELNSFREDVFTVGTLGATSFVVRGLQELPGRKSVVLMSDGISLLTRDNERRTRVFDALQRMIELANRASVVFYTLDSRGLQTLGLTAEDNLNGMTQQQIGDSLANRRNNFFESQNGLNYLAAQTGGLFIRNTNDINAGLRRILNDQSGYYLLAYKPDASTFDSSGKRRFVNISIKVKRPGVRVRTRTGFYNVPDERLATRPRTRVEQLRQAINSPIASADIPLRLTSIFANYERLGSYIRSSLYIDASKLTFTPEADGWRKAVIDVVALTFGADGKVIDEVNRAQTIRVRNDTYTRIIRDGVIYNLSLPVKKSGAYQLRVAVRDTVNERTGAANQFIEVPNVDKKRLALSGIVLQGNTQTNDTQTNNTQAGNTTGSATNNAANSDLELERLDAQASPAVRRLRQGMISQYAYVVYNATVDRATRQPKLQTQVRVWRDGKPIFTAPPLAFEVGAQVDLKRLVVGRALQLGAEMLPGDYLLQVIVTDLLDKNRTVTQWIDFEIVK